MVDDTIPKQDIPERGAQSWVWIYVRNIVASGFLAAQANHHSAGLAIDAIHAVRECRAGQYIPAGGYGGWSEAIHGEQTNHSRLMKRDQGWSHTTHI